MVPPLVYPAQVNCYSTWNEATEVGTGKTQDKKQEPDVSAINEDEGDDLGFMDSVEIKDDPNQPLTPLPAPLVPEVLQGAKKASVMGAFGKDGELCSWLVCVVCKHESCQRHGTFEQKTQKVKVDI